VLPFLPGTSNCNFAKAPALTTTLALVLAVSVPAASVAVIVRAPAVLKVKVESVRVPETKVIWPAVAPLSSAILAFESELVIVTFGVALTTFQFASTALTIIPPTIPLPAVCADGVPVFPLAVPGAAVSARQQDLQFGYRACIYGYGRAGVGRLAVVSHIARRHQSHSQPFSKSR
jgi:hypothetical protein